MKAFIRRLPPVVEFSVVIAIAFGLWLTQGIATLALRWSTTQPLKWPPFTNAAALSLTLLEIGVLAVVYGIGRLRGWSFAAFGLRLTWRLTAIGIALIALIQFPALLLLRESFAVFTGSVSLLVIVPLLLANACFEESLEVGYVFHSLARQKPWLAVLVSATLRASLHLYLGGLAFAAVFVGGIIYAVLYWRVKQLWPLVLAHFIMGLVFLWPLVRFPQM